MNKSRGGKPILPISPVRCVLYFVVGVVAILIIGIATYFISSSGVAGSTLRATTTVSPTPGSDFVGELSPALPPAPISKISTPPPTRPKVAVAITVTKDGPFVDGALVLGYAARYYHSAATGYPSKFDIDLVAFVTKKVVSTRNILQRFGWRVLERDLPVALDEIENQDYANRMRDSGCCGADEFLKLWAYTLTEYHRVLHLDMDCIIFRNLDALLSMDKELVYTGDYNMKGSSPVAPAQGGFLVIRPSMDRFKEFQAIIRKGDHGPQGWGHSRIGNFWGGQTIQGIMPYFYHVVHPGDGQEVNRCQYNNMVDNPYHKNTMRCIDGNATCEDCRLSDPSKVFTAHFTICQKPWTCTEHLNPRNMQVCKAFHAKWFALRDQYEKELGISPSYRATRTRFRDSLGMCRGYGDDKYLPMPIDTIRAKETA